jgi:Tol biopolymer transport system component
MSVHRLLAPWMAGVVLLCAAPAAAVTPTTVRVSIAYPGGSGTSGTAHVAVSRTGRFIAFTGAGGFSAGAGNGVQIHLRDRTEGTTVRVSVSSSGETANGGSRLGAISGNGRWVVFSSTATNLVPRDTNGVEDVFVRDVVAGVTVRASVSSTGAQANGPSTEPVISADGHVVAFTSEATNLVSNDTNGRTDVFVRHLGTLTTSRASLSTSGGQLKALSHNPAISGDGSYVAFASYAVVDPADTDGWQDVFVCHRPTGECELVSRTTSGATTQDNASALPVISADGGTIAFTSWATDMGATDDNDEADAFVWSRATGTVSLITKEPDGSTPDGETRPDGVSGDGEMVVFISDAAGFVTGDTNGDWDAFVLDRATGKVRRVSVRENGGQASRPTYVSRISGDGRFAAVSTAAKLTASDTDSVPDVFLRGPLR